MNAKELGHLVVMNFELYVHMAAVELDLCYDCRDVQIQASWGIPRAHLMMILDNPSPLTSYPRRKYSCHINKDKATGVPRREGVRACAETEEAGQLPGGVLRGLVLRVGEAGGLAAVQAQRARQVHRLQGVQHARLAIRHRLLCKCLTSFVWLTSLDLASERDVPAGAAGGSHGAGSVRLVRKHVLSKAVALAAASGRAVSRVDYYVDRVGRSGWTLGSPPSAAPWRARPTTAVGGPRLDSFVTLKADVCVFVR
jgi:hypothetical protein